MHGKRESDAAPAKGRAIRNRITPIAVKITDASSVSPEQLRGLTERIEQMREAERARIARELHDELGQLLTGIKLDFSAAVRRLREMKPAGDIVDRVQSAIMQIDIAITTVGRISGELRPAALDHRDLGGAIEYESRLAALRSGLDVRVVNRVIDAVPLDAATAAFRIFQEALTNAVRHSQATRISTRVVTRVSRLELYVRDNGKGIDSNDASASFGILGMHERARNAGGRLVIRGRPGRGTLLALCLPLGAER